MFKTQFMKLCRKKRAKLAKDINKRLWKCYGCSMALEDAKTSKLLSDVIDFLKKAELSLNADDDREREKQ